MATIHVRDVPEAVVEVLRRRAAAEGQSLSAYLRDMLERESQPTVPEWLDLCRRDGPGVRLSVPSAEVIREVRAERGLD